MLSALEFDDVANTRYYQSADGDVFMGVSQVIDGRLRFAIGKQVPAPTYEHFGEFKVADAPGGARWIAPTYCVFFPKTSIVGIIFSAEGPRMYQVAQYFEKGIKFPHRIETEELARADIVAELQRLKAVQKLEIKYLTSATPNLFAGKHEDLDDVFANLAHLREGVEVTIILNAGKDPGAALSGLREKFQKLLASNPFTVTPKRFKVWGQDRVAGREKLEVNLLLSKIAVTKKVQLAKDGKYLEKESAFRAIEGAYAENLANFPSISIRDS